MIRSINTMTSHLGLHESLGLRRMLGLGALALILGTVALPVPTAWAVPTDYVISDAATTTNGGATLSTSKRPLADIQTAPPADV